MSCDEQNRDLNGIGLQHKVVLYLPGYLVHANNDNLNSLRSRSLIWCYEYTHTRQIRERRSYQLFGSESVGRSRGLRVKIPRLRRPHIQNSGHMATQHKLGVSTSEFVSCMILANRKHRGPSATSATSGKSGRSGELRALVRATAAAESLVATWFVRFFRFSVVELWRRLGQSVKC